MSLRHSCCKSVKVEYTEPSKAVWRFTHAYGTCISISYPKIKESNHHECCQEQELNSQSGLGSDPVALVLARWGVLLEHQKPMEAKLSAKGMLLLLSPLPPHLFEELIAET